MQFVLIRAIHVRAWATTLDDPADALGHKYYILPTDDNGNPLAPASNIVNFAAGWRAGVELTTGLDIQPLVI